MTRYGISSLQGQAVLSSQVLTGQVQAATLNRDSMVQAATLAGAASTQAQALARDIERQAANNLTVLLAAINGSEIAGRSQFAAVAAAQAKGQSDLETSVAASRCEAEKCCLELRAAIAAASQTAVQIAISALNTGTSAGQISQTAAAMRAVAAATAA